MSKDGSHFPSGLRVLLVDNDIRSLENLWCRLQQGCNYEVTPRLGANDALLSLLLEKKNGFDIILISYSMPDMDGIRFLESIRSMEAATYQLPVVLFSGEQDRDVVIRAIEKGASDFLLKPIRDETLKMIWQHVVRLNVGKERTVDNSISEVNQLEGYGSAIHSPSYDAIASQSEGSSKRKRDDRCDEENDNNAGTASATAMKKARVHWTPELHQKFLDAIDIIDRRKNQYRLFGINESNADGEHAVPMEILVEMRKMGVTGLTRQHVSSHLQKYRKNKNEEAKSTAQQNTQSNQSYPTPGQCYSLFPAPAADYQHLIPESCEVNYGVQQFSNYSFSSIGQRVSPCPVSRMTNQHALSYNRPVQSSMWNNRPMMLPAPHDSGNQQKPPEPPDAINRAAPKISQGLGNIKDGIPEPVPQTGKAEQPNTAGFDATVATTDYTSFDMGNLAAPTALYEVQDIGPLGLEGLDQKWLDVFVDSSGSII